MFSKQLLERAVKTFLQAFFATLAATFMIPSDFSNISNWKAAGIAALVASVSAGLSAVSSFLSRPWAEPGTASMVSTVIPGSSGDNRA